MQRRGRSRQPPRTPLGARIDAALEATGLSHKELAARIGVSDSNISHWRLGRHAPDWESIRKLAAVAGQSAYTLLTGEPDPGAVVALLRQAREAWRERVSAGDDPADAWEEILGQPGLLTEEERAVLSTDASGVREFLATADGREWVRLDPEAQRVLRDLLRLLARRPGSDDGPGMDRGPMPAGTTP